MGCSTKGGRGSHDAVPVPMGDPFVGRAQLIDAAPGSRHPAASTRWVWECDIFLCQPFGDGAGTVPRRLGTAPGSVLAGAMGQGGNGPSPPSLHPHRGGLIPAPQNQPCSLLTFQSLEEGGTEANSNLGLGRVGPWEGWS